MSTHTDNDNLENTEESTTEVESNVSKNQESFKTSQNDGFDNSKAKQIREATEAKVRRQYESKFKELESRFDSMSDQFTTQLNQRDEVIESLYSNAKAHEMDTDMNSLRSIGVPEDRLVDAYNFAQATGFDSEGLQGKITNYFVPQSNPEQNSFLSTAPQNVSSETEVSDATEKLMNVRNKNW